MTDFSVVKDIIIPEGRVQQITSGDTLLWKCGPDYTNLLSLATDAQGDPYNNGLGFKTGYRINSSRVEIEKEGMCCTGFMPVSANDVVRIKNITVAGTSGGYIMYFGSDRQTYHGFDAPSTTLINPENGVYTFTTKNNTAIAYMRISIGTIDETTIITANEEIPS